MTISIVATNDLHGALLTRDGRGGVALLGGYLKNLRAARARDGGAVLLLDAGDMFQWHPRVEPTGARVRAAGTRIFPPRHLCVREDPETQTCAPDVRSATLVPAVYEGVPVTSDGAIDRVLAAAMEQVRVLKDQPVGVVLETPLGRQGPGPLNLLVTDAMLASTPGADVALVNPSGVRADLPKGPLTYGSVFEAVPFDNVVVPIRLTGGQLRQVIASRLGNSRPLLRFSGMRVRAQCAGGALDVALTRPSGVPIQDDDALLVVVSDFLATGGDGALADVTPREGFVIPSSAPLQRDVFVAYVRSLGSPLRADMFVDEGNPRFEFRGESRLTCVAQ